MGNIDFAVSDAPARISWFYDKEPAEPLWLIQRCRPLSLWYLIALSRIQEVSSYYLLRILPSRAFLLLLRSFSTSALFSVDCRLSFLLWRLSPRTMPSILRVPQTFACRRLLACSISTTIQPAIMMPASQPSAHQLHQPCMPCSRSCASPRNDSSDRIILAPSMPLLPQPQ